MFRKLILKLKGRDSKEISTTEIEEYLRTNDVITINKTSYVVVRSLFFDKTKYDNKISSNNNFTECIEHILIPENEYENNDCKNVFFGEIHIPKPTVLHLYADNKSIDIHGSIFPLKNDLILINGCINEIVRINKNDGKCLININQWNPCSLSHFREYPLNFVDNCR